MFSWFSQGDSPPLTINEMDTVAEIERVSAPELITEGDSSPLMVVTKSDQYFQFNLWTTHLFLQFENIPFAICQFCFCYLTLLVLISSCPTSYATAKFVPGCHESSWSSWRERASCVAKLFPPKNIWRSTTVPSIASSSKIGKQKACLLECTSTVSLLDFIVKFTILVNIKSKIDRRLQLSGFRKKIFVVVFER